MVSDYFGNKAQGQPNYDKYQTHYVIWAYIILVEWISNNDDFVGLNQTFKLNTLSYVGINR